MGNLDFGDSLFIAAAFLFQIILIFHFTLRKWLFDTAIRYGPVVYALGLAAAVVSVILLASGKGWAFWLAGLLYLAWGIFGYIVEYRKNIQWRSSVRWPILVPYLLLYLATSMFYWFPLALIWKPLWYAYGVLFVASFILNVTSHRKPDPAVPASR